MNGELPKIGTNGRATATTNADVVRAMWFGAPAPAEPPEPDGLYADVIRGARAVDPDQVLHYLTEMATRLPALFELAQPVVADVALVGDGVPGEEPLGQALHLRDIDEPAPRRYLVGRHIPEGNHISILFAPGGAGKSYCAVLLCCCLRLGRPFLGLEVQEQDAILWIDAENMGLEETTRRFYEVVRGLERPLDRPPAGIYYHHLSDPLGSDRAQAEILHLIERHKITFCLVDSLTVGSAGDVKEQRDLVPLLRSMQRWGCPVLAIDHTTKAGAANQAYATAYGSVFKQAMCRSLLKLTKAPGGGRTLEQDKTNFGPEAPPLNYTMDFDGEGEAKKTVRFQRRAGTEDDFAGSEENMRPLDHAFSALCHLYDEQKPPRLPVTAVDVQERLRGDGREVALGTVQNNLSALYKQGRAERVTKGNYVPVRDDDAFRIAAPPKTTPPNVKPLFRNETPPDPAPF